MDSYYDSISACVLLLLLFPHVHTDNRVQLKLLKQSHPRLCPKIPDLNCISIVMYAFHCAFDCPSLMPHMFQTAEFDKNLKVCEYNTPKCWHLALEGKDGDDEEPVLRVQGVVVGLDLPPVSTLNKWVGTFLPGFCFTYCQTGRTLIAFGICSNPSSWLVVLLPLLLELSRAC